MELADKVRELIENDYKELKWAVWWILEKRLEEIEKRNKIINYIVKHKDELMERIKKYFPLPKSKKSKTYQMLVEELGKLSNDVRFYVRRSDVIDDWIVAFYRGYEVPVIRYDKKKNELVFLENLEDSYYSEEKVYEAVKEGMELLRDIKERIKDYSFGVLRESDFQEVVKRII